MDNFVTVGWTNDGGHEAVYGYTPFCNPPHSNARRRLKEMIGYSEMRDLARGWIGDAVWRYDRRLNDVIRDRHENIGGVGCNVALAAIGKEVADDREELEKLFARSAPRLVAELAQGIVMDRRGVIRAMIANAGRNVGMAEAFAVIRVNNGAACVDNGVVTNAEYVQWDIKGLPSARAEWKDGRLLMTVPGIPEGHVMSGWADMNQLRHSGVRDELIGMCHR